MEKTVIDARGDQCPIPVVKTIHALANMKETGVLEVRVDNEIAVQNLLRLANNRNLKAYSEKLADQEFVVTLSVEDLTGVLPKETACAAAKRSDLVVAVDSEVMGRGSDELGRTLMKGFLYALSQQENLPDTVLFYNGGAKLTVEGSVSVEDLKNMEAQGVEVLTCGTCLNFFGLTEKLAVGSVTNMYTIVEKLSGAGQVIKP